MFNILIKDESMTGKVLSEIEIQVKEEWIKVKDLIAARVEKEVEVYNQKQPDVFKGLIQPTIAEQTLNGYKMKKRKNIDAEKQVYVALDAFQKNGFFVLVNDRQAESLEEKVLVGANTSISFVKLTPLVGG